MKIALLGSAPSSVRLAPFGNPEWRIWACSPGTYSILPRCDAFFELHRWEPGVVGKPDTQKPWFSPEYVAWMGKQALVWMLEPVSEIPGSRALPYEPMSQRWGTYFWTSSLAYMLAMAMDEIIAERERRKAAGMSQADQDAASKGDVVGMWGVDMSATEEYGYQRAGCQHFLCEANRLGIGVYVPPESDLLRPMPPYGLMESSHWHIKGLARLRELEGRKAHHEAVLSASQAQVHFLAGAIDDCKYHLDTWGDDRQGVAPSPELSHFMRLPIAQIEPAKAEAAEAMIAAGAKLDALPVPTRKPKAPKKRRR